MYQIGDRVVYGIHGVCQIVGLEERSVDRKNISYFALEPLDQPGTRYYIPSENPSALAKLRYLISAEDLQALLASSEIRESCWIADENQRKQRYRELINSSDRVALLQMINTLHQHKKAQAATGRKFYLCDENFLRDAEKLLNAEFSLVLGIKPSDVGAYILSVLDK
jgi:CarD family transcriptional regulator